MNIKKTVIICGVTLLFLSGCATPVPGFRFAPAESQKQAAQTADDMAKATPYVGLQPGSEAAKILARSTGPSRAYLGSPSNPVDIWPIMESQRGAWETKARQIEALKLKETLMARTNTLVGDALAEIAMLASEKSNVSSRAIIPKIEGMISIYDMATQLSAEIDVPSDPELAGDLAGRMLEVESTVNKAIKAAEKQAARRPTGKELAVAAADAVREGSETAKGIAATIGQIATDWGLPAIGGGGILGAILYGKKKKQQIVAETARAKIAEHGQAVAEKAAEGAAAAVDATKSIAETAMRAATDALAKAEPLKP